MLRPRVFISAVSSELTSARQLVANALTSLGYEPFWQEIIPTDEGDLCGVLRRQIDSCKGVIQLVGQRYGIEPPEHQNSFGRASCTQYEALYARSRGKKVWKFLLADEFPSDAVRNGLEPEASEFIELQQAYRKRIESEADLYHSIHNEGELESRVHQLRNELNIFRRRLQVWILGASGALLLIAGLAIESRLNPAVTVGDIWEANESLRERDRDYIRLIAAAFMDQSAVLDELELTVQERFDRAMAKVAADVGLPEEELRNAIKLFVAAVETDPDAGLMDRAMAAFAQQNYVTAASAAGQAAEIARRLRLAAEVLEESSRKEKQKQAKAERDARELQGQSLYAAKDFGGAVAALQKAIEITSRDEFPEAWAMLQERLGSAARSWALRSTGDAIEERRTMALGAYNAALEVLTREGLPQYWAMTHVNLALALTDQAIASEGLDRVRLLEEAVAAYHSALQVYTRESLPRFWAEAQIGLADSLSEQASASEGMDHVRLLGEAVAAYRKALDVFDRESLPQDWATAQNNLAVALSDQALALVGLDRVRLLEEAVTACRAALEVHTREALPQDWAITQNNLADILRILAAVSEVPDRASLLRDAVTACRATLEVFTRESLPRYWAKTHVNLALTLRDQASASGGLDRAQLLEEAVAAYHSALQVYTRESLPQEWAETQSNLAIALSDQAMIANEREDGCRLLGETVAAYRGALEFINRESLPQDWARTQSNLANALARQAWVSDGLDRIRLLEEAVAAYRAALEILIREAMPHAYAVTQVNLANVLTLQARVSDGLDRPRLLEEAVAAYRDALEVYTRESSPLDWATTHVNLALALREQSSTFDGTERVRLLQEAVAARKNALEVHTADFASSLHAEGVAWIAETEAEIAGLSGN